MALRGHMALMNHLIIGASNGLYPVRIRTITLTTLHCHFVTSDNTFNPKHVHFALRKYIMRFHLRNCLLDQHVRTPGWFHLFFVNTVSNVVAHFAALSSLNAFVYVGICLRAVGIFYDLRKWTPHLVSRNTQSIQRKWYITRFITICR